MQMSDSEMRELDVWLTRLFPEHEFVQYHDGPHRVNPNGLGLRMKTFVPFHPTTDAAAAMEVLRKCCQKGERGTEVKISLNGNQWRVLNEDDYDQAGRAETLETAICLFAKEVHSK